jgi:hypothetical protein
VDRALQSKCSRQRGVNAGKQQQTERVTRPFTL